MSTKETPLPKLWPIDHDCVPQKKTPYMQGHKSRYRLKSKKQISDCRDEVATTLGQQKYT
jgi:hypothetical protein